MRGPPIKWSNFAASVQGNARRASPMNTSDFTVLPRRWVVERTSTWLSRNRRLAKDFEIRVENAQAYLQLAIINLLT